MSEPTGLYTLWDKNTSLPALDGSSNPIQHKTTTGSEDPPGTINLNPTGLEAHLVWLAEQRGDPPAFNPNTQELVEGGWNAPDIPNQVIVYITTTRAKTAEEQEEFNRQVRANQLVGLAQPLAVKVRDGETLSQSEQNTLNEATVLALGLDLS